MADVAPVIIIKKIKKGHGGHHGGAWKVAYADFVTAMMAFFLLLWLLNVTTDVERKGIADYFSPASISKSESGAGGVMGGQTINQDGAQMNYNSPPTTQDVTVPTVGKGEEGEEDVKTVKDTEKEKVDTSSMTPEQKAIYEAMQQEEKTFKAAEDALKQAILSSPTLQGFANQIVIDRTPEGLRIQIIDRDKFSMFPSGAAVPYEKGRDLLLLVGKVLARLPNSISVSGHTDSAPFQPGSRRDNWTLSTERANVSRQYLVQAGVADDRVSRVAGLADRDPFTPTDPKDPRNRRISIILMRHTIPPVEATASPQSAPNTTPAIEP